MRHCASSCLGDLADVYREDVELITVARPQADGASSVALVDRLAELPLQERWTQRCLDAEPVEQRLRSCIPAPLLGPLAADITLAVSVLHDLLGCASVGIRLATLHGPMCPRFHVDHVPCRLLVTLAGPGTQWIARDDVDAAAFDARASTPPLRDGAAVRQVAAGAWTLLKGGAWQDGFRGVVHRSPQERSQRLLLSLDPLFDQGAG